MSETNQGQIQPEIVFKLNKSATLAFCSCCKTRGRMSMPFAAFLEGSSAWVCQECINRQFGFNASDPLDLMNDAASITLKRIGIVPLLMLTAQMVEFVSRPIDELVVHDIPV